MSRKCCTGERGQGILCLNAGDDVTSEPRRQFGLPMSEHESGKRVPGLVVTLVCAMWIVAVTAAFCISYGGALIQYARGAAGRSPSLSQILELLHLGA